VALMLLTELRVQNFRGIKKLDLKLDSSTVLIGENNCGKSTILAAIRCALEQARHRRSPAFDDFDYHLTSAANDPHFAPPITIDLIFREPPEDEWPPELVQSLNDIISFDDNDGRFIWLRASSQWEETTSDFVSKAEFLDKDQNPLTGRGAHPANLNALQRLRPFFYLSALRDAGKEFSKQSQYWGSFLRGSSISRELKTQLETELSEINAKVVQAHEPFESIKSQLSRLQQLIPTSNLTDVSIEAVPGRLFDMLSRTQVNISSATGAKLPIAKHGEGTQSLSVLLLFDAFLKSRLVKAFERSSTPIVAIEEPEAHLHPCAIRTLWKTIDSLSGQKIVSSHSGDLLAEVPAEKVRRLYRVNGGIEVGQLKATTLNATQLRMFNHHVRTSRGELLFANCWLLCEGESEILLLRKCADLIGADFSQWGVRLVEYRNGGDIALYLKVASDFGINWHCFSDNDRQGKLDHRKIRDHLNGRQEADHLTVTPAANLEQYLATVGIFPIYEAELTDQIRKNLITNVGDAGYVQDVVAQVINVKKKPDLITKVAQYIEQQGAAAIPPVILTAIQKAVALAGGTIP